LDPYRLMVSYSTLLWDPDSFMLTYLNIVSSAGSSLGTGGMGTKIIAARLATSAGVTTVITKSSLPGNIVKIVRYVQAQKQASLPATTPNQVVDGEAVEDPLSQSTASLTIDPIEKPPLHTRFTPLDHPLRDRYIWILHGLAPHGTIYIDAGAHRALSEKAGLLPVGIIDVEGHFGQQEAVKLVVVERRAEPGPDGRLWEGQPVEVGRAVVNYAAPEILRVKGKRSREIKALLGYADSEYIADRDNVSLMRRESRPVSPVFADAVVAEAVTKGVAAYENGPVP